MTVWQRANPIIQHVSFIIVRAKGDFILFDGVELMFKWSYTLYGLHKFSFFKQKIYIVLVANVFFDYFLLLSLCLLHFFFLCIQRIHFCPQTNKLFNNFPIQLVLHFTDYFFCFHFHRMDFLSRSQKNRTTAYQHKSLLKRYLFEFDMWGTCIGKQRRRVWILSLDVIVVEIMHQRFRKIHDSKSHIDRSVQR